MYPNLDKKGWSWEWANSQEEDWSHEQKEKEEKSAAEEDGVWRPVFQWG